MQSLCPFRLVVELKFICTIDNTELCINSAKADADYCFGNDYDFIPHIFASLANL